LFRGPLAGRVDGLVDLLGARGQGSGDAADVPVRGEAQSVLVPTFEELRERVLQERERPGLMGDVGDQLGNQPGLGSDADPFGRPPDRPLELVGYERGQRLGPLGEQLAEAGVDKWAVVEVRPEGHDHAKPTLGVGGGDAKRLQEEFPLLLVSGEGEGLLELIDKEHDLRLAGRHEIHRLEQSPGS
jgi:hypothetical protein